MNLDELIEQAQDAAVEYLNIQRLDDIEGRYNFHGITQSDANLLIQAVRGLHRRRRILEEALLNHNIILREAVRLLRRLKRHHYHGKYNPYTKSLFKEQIEAFLAKGEHDNDMDL